MRGRVLNENFDFNPKNLKVVPNKPTDRPKHLKEESKTEEGDDTLKKKLEVLGAVPKKKYPYPMTAAQEVGWDMDNFYDAHKPKYSFNRQTQAECQYANNYILTFHKNPHTINTKPQMPAEPPKK